MARAGGSLLLSAAVVAEQAASEGYLRACFLGSGSLASVAKESALKVPAMTAGK